MLPKFLTESFNIAQVDFWIDQASAAVRGGSFQEICERVAAYLSSHTYLVGCTLTIADLAFFHQLLNSRQWEAIKTRPSLGHLLRWFNSCMMNGTLRDVATAHGASFFLTLKTLRFQGIIESCVSTSGGSFKINLDNATEGCVVTRFPPEPSGYLHIGHAKAALLNQYFARLYKGKLIIRFDDTNPSKERDEFVENILQDCETLGLKPDAVTYTSDSFSQILEMGSKLIREGNMYIDDTPLDLMRHERINRIESAARGNTVEDNLRLWGDMIAGNEKGLECAARFRMDMQSDNGSLRDPVAFRCNLSPHHRTGTTHKVYPTYDCACPFVDALEAGNPSRKFFSFTTVFPLCFKTIHFFWSYTLGVTHALRTSEYRDREDQYHWVQNMMGLRKVHIWDYSRLNFVYTTLSKRKLQWFVDHGYAESWNDPRFPTVQGLKRRGLQIEALKEFILMQGASRNVNLMEWEKLWTLNIRIIDPVCPRHTAVEDEGRVAVTLLNGPVNTESVSVPRNKKYPSAGTKVSSRMSRIWLDLADAELLEEGVEVTLMDWGNCIIKKIFKDGPSGATVSMEAELNLKGCVKSTKMKLTWLPNMNELVPLKLLDFDYLITKKKVEEEDNLADVVNKQSKVEIRAHGDADLGKLRKGDVLQLERKGYYVVDAGFEPGVQPMVLLCIPDGRTRSWGVSRNK